MATRTFLLEIGTEELPSSFVDAALESLPALVEAELERLRLRHGEIVAGLGTPRRLAIQVRALADAQDDLDELIVGPPESVAMKDGKPTRALEAFLSKMGADPESVRFEHREAQGSKKAGTYAVLPRREKGAPALDVLPSLVEQICEKIPFRKSMRWGTGDTAFGRPVQWLVALYGDAIVNASFAGVQSGRETRGHRFLAPKPFDLKSADAYIEPLREAHVIVSRDDRTIAMVDALYKAADALGGKIDDDPELLIENASLVEKPFVLTGQFDEAFLALPDAVIRSVLRGHQKCFCVGAKTKSGEPGALIAKYLSVVNTANDPEKIIKGSDRVMRARLADAKFFFEEDKKSSSEERVAKLEKIVFHGRLGTVHDKTRRLEHLAAHIALVLLRMDQDAAETIRRAAHLAKSDLVSLMVGEFPELQGDMGRAYALAEGEPEEICNAIRDHYKPVGATDGVPGAELSAIVALADRLDSLVGCFSIGLAPTGTTDPFALRRACIAILRILGEGPSEGLSHVPLSALVAAAYDQYAAQHVRVDRSKDETVNAVMAFASDRLRGLLAQGTDVGVADAVLGGITRAEAREGEKSEVRDLDVVELPRLAFEKATYCYDSVTRGEDWLGIAKAVAKRLAGIGKSAKPVLHGASAFDGAHADKNRPFVDLVTELDEITRSLEDGSRIFIALTEMGGIAKKLGELFESVLVNDPDDPSTPKRLELLAYGAGCMRRIADFSRLNLKGEEPS